MCGLLGVAGANCLKAVSDALDLIAHRGPDGSGLYADEHVTLGHRRLAVIDPWLGQQPFHSADGRHVLIQNGEIYNFKDLKAQLRARGHVFRTNSDTEVLLYWLIEYGKEGLPALNGMFALALWDRTEKSLLLARDRIGIKPLYHASREGTLIFSSEIKAMLPWLPSVEPNHAAIFDFLTFQNILTGHTFFKGVHKLEPGTWLQWTPGQTTHGRYWDISFAQHDRADSPEAAVEEFRDTLERSVRRHLVSDVPLGSYLSGGIDSSAVATMAASVSGAKMHTFTGAFTDAPYYDERIGSRAVANRIGAELHEIEILPNHHVDHLQTVLWHLDEPTLGTGALPQYLVSKLVSQHVTVVLTGHGGDELFAGYQVNKVALMKEALRRRPATLPAILARIPRDEWSRVLYYLLYPAFQAEARHGLFIMTPVRKRSDTLTGDFLSDVKGHEPLTGVDALVRGRAYTPSQALFVLYLKTYLPTLLIQEDKVGMAHSIEARTPLCDNEMIDLALRLPLSTKMFGQQLKAVPRAAMRSLLPDMLYTLPKRGFPTPFARWYRKEPVRSQMADLLLSETARKRGIFNSTFVESMFRRNAESSTDTLVDYARANRLYSIALIELWFRTFVDRDPVHDRIPSLSIGAGRVG